MLDKKQRPPVALAIALMAGCLNLSASLNIDPPNGRDAEIDLASHSVGAWGVDLSGADKTVRPGDNFYMFLNGAWFARTDITTGNAAYWRDLRRLSPLRLAAALEEVSRNKVPATTSAGKAGAFYQSFLDGKTREETGVKPLGPELAAIRAIKTKAEMAALMGKEAGPGTQRSTSVQTPPSRGLFTLGIAQDQQDLQHYAVYVGQDGMLLPGPEFYLDPKLADFKTAYQAYAARLLALVGWEDPEKSAADIVDFETRIARASWFHEQLLDAVNTYSPVSVAELAKFAPGFDWNAFFSGAELQNVKQVVINAKTAFPKIASVYAETPLPVLQARQAFATADSDAERLNKDMRKAHFDFRNRMFNGQSITPMPDNMQAEQMVEANMPDALDELYIARYFSSGAKAKALQMVTNIKLALRTRLENVSWMTPETRSKALQKLARMKVKAGSPERFEQYKGLLISDHDLFGNAERAAAFNWRQSVATLGRPFDRTPWSFPASYPQYGYVATTNTLEIPAGVLQPPFFDLHADEAVNYGSVGALMAQAMLTGFDRQGRHYDADGRLHDWWTPEESHYFDGQAAKLREQYSAIEPIPGVHVNGELVLDQAIQDIGAIQLALDAYKISLKGQTPPVLDGYSGQQRVFLGRAHMWRAKFNLGFVRNQLATGQNAPPFVRVNGPLPQIDEWYAAFNVKPGDKMYIAPEERVHIW